MRHDDILCFALSNDRMRIREESRFFKPNVAPAWTTLDCIAVAACLTLTISQRATNTVQADATEIMRKSMAFAGQNMGRSLSSSSRS
jgi:hypothetical protein